MRTCLWHRSREKRRRRKTARILLRPASAGLWCYFWNHFNHKNRSALMFCFRIVVHTPEHDPLCYHSFFIAESVWLIIMLDLFPRCLMTGCFLWPEGEIFSSLGISLPVILCVLTFAWKTVFYQTFERHSCIFVFPKRMKFSECSYTECQLHLACPYLYNLRILSAAE